MAARGEADSCVARRSLDPHPSSVSAARGIVREVLRDAGRDDLVEDARLAVSELVTNALVHAGTTVGLVVRVGPAGLRVEVTDGSAHQPTPRNHLELAGTGRGLIVLDSFVDSWGVQARPEGKTVWFELSAVRNLSSGPDPNRSTDATEADWSAIVAQLEQDSRSETLEVVLLQTPLLLHAAWQMQAESLLREYLLTRLSPDTAADEMENHAAVHDALAFLQQQIPAPPLGGELAEDLVAAAVEPLVTASRLVLTIPRASVVHFEQLDRTLDAAMRMADAGEFLTPPLQPEGRQFRRWLCAEVAAQAAGGGPRPWSGDAPEQAAPVGA